MWLRHAIPLLLLGPAAGCGDPITKQHVPLAASAEIPATQWLEFVAPEPLRTSAFHHQVCFTPVHPARLSEDPMGIVDQHGAPISVRVVAVGSGEPLELPLAAYQDRQVCFGVSDQELDRKFDRIRIFASATLSIERAEWQSTDK